MCYLQITCVSIMHEASLNYESRSNYIAGLLVVILLSQITSFPQYASVHSVFALEYLRASLTVPLYFER